MEEKMIHIESAFTNNLKNINVHIPLNKLTVITGVSGSGKSSLAFDTIYEAGRRRYLMFSGLEAESNPTYKSITGLSPTVALEQRVIRQTNVRSTVGTKSQISQGLAYLYATCGEYKGNGKESVLGMEHFNKNTTKGMCLRCLGKGHTVKIDYEKFLHPETMKLSELLHGKIKNKRDYVSQLEAFCRKNDFNLDTTIKELSTEQKRELVFGDTTIQFDGLEMIFNDFTGNTLFSKGRKHSDIYNIYTNKCVCNKCNGYGLSQIALNTYLEGMHIGEMCDLTILELKDFISKLSCNKDGITKAILEKIELLIEVGLSHLSLSRSVITLSGGELQRVFLASYLITNLQSLIFVFDEPTIGLHESEKKQLIDLIHRLVKQGNTVIVVEHDKNFIESADYIIDIGPDAGIKGGEVIFQGEYEKFLFNKKSNTSCYLNGSMKIDRKKKYREVQQNNMLSLKNVNTHNLNNVSVEIPLQVMVGIAGVSGSGKSSLISDTLVPILREKLKNKFIDMSDESNQQEERYFANISSAKVQGVEKIAKCIIVDQKPIGRKSTSTPISYLGGLDRIREIFANVPLSNQRGYVDGMFSKNSKGKCPHCLGEGVITYNIGLGNELYLKCDECHGTGFVSEILDIKVKGKNIYDVMQMSFVEALEFFKNDRKLSKIFQIMIDVGLEYIKLGQKTTTISGGEAQRIKLAKELSKSTQNCLFILDEPTTGLSFKDISRLMKLLDKIVDNGNSIIIVEHDTSVLSNCDYLIELGPKGGKEGGNIIASGSPKQLINNNNNNNSVIAKYLYPLV